ncbi:14_t:CDS:2 [Rhizophagus irregularis]|nr:14_t:CDS:2 [Rhizophagus irregularis]
MSNSQSENIDLNKKKRGRPKTDVWEYFKEGPRNRGHCSAECNFCGWKQQIGQPIEMQGYIAINCSKAPYEIKTIFLEKPKINEKFESTKIDQVKVEMVNHAIVKFFGCCGIPFHIIENPFFIDLLRVDGWTNARGQSLYAFILITKERKEYVHSVQNLLNYSHTGRFLADKMIEIIENVGSTKFGGIVSDNASAIVFAKKLVND